jgi:hypothetical protein
MCSSCLMLTNHQLPSARISDICQPDWDGPSSSSSSSSSPLHSRPSGCSSAGVVHWLLCNGAQHTMRMEFATAPGVGLSLLAASWQPAAPATVSSEHVSSKKFTRATVADVNTAIAG